VSQLFADGFESGNYSAWTGTTQTGTTTLSVDPVAALTGSQGSRSTHSTAGDNNYEAKATKVFTPPPTARLFALAAVRLTSVIGVGYSVAGSKAVLAVRAQDGQEQAWFSLRTGGLRFSYRAGNGSIIAINSSIPLSTGTVAFLRILIDRAGLRPIVQGWISANGIDWLDVGSATDVSIGTQGVAKASGQIDVGIVHISNFEPGNYTIDCDGVQILDSLTTTDWQVLSNLVQPIRIVHASSVDRRATTIQRSSVSVAAQGVRNAVSDPTYQMALRTALTGRREALTTSSELVKITQDGRASVDRRAASVVGFGLDGTTDGNKDWQQAFDLDFGLGTNQHARMGEIVQPVTVRVSDRTWGEVSVMDSEA
jgi:hypothetical protein